MHVHKQMIFSLLIFFHLALDHMMTPLTDPTLTKSSTKAQTTAIHLVEDYNSVSDTCRVAGRRGGGARGVVAD